MRACGAEPRQRGARGKAKEAPVIDPSTMSLKAIIKCAYAQERARMEEERRRKVQQPSSQMPLTMSSPAGTGLLRPPIWLSGPEYACMASAACLTCVWVSGSADT